MKVRSLVAAGLLALMACGGEPTFVGKNLGTIMPSASDAPRGTELDTSPANFGPKPLDQFVTDPTVKARLNELGFRVAYVTTFATRNYVPDRDKAPVGSAFYGAFAIILKDVAAAEDGFDFYRDRLRGRARDLTPVVNDDVGIETFSFRFSSLEDTPLPGLAILWRRGNALFSVVGVGNPFADPNATRGLAATIDRRAEDAG